MKRRNFIKTGLAAGMGMGSLQAAEKSTCGLAIGTYGLQSMSLPKAIDLVAKTGFDAIELFISPQVWASLNSDEEVKVVRDVIESSGVRLCALMVDLRPEVDDHKHHLELANVGKYVRLARKLCPGSPPLLQTVLGGKVWEDSRNLFRDRIANWNQILADQKGYLSIKPHRGHAMSTPEQAAWLLKQLGNPRRLSMVYDYSHFAFRDPEMSIADTVDAALPITKYIAVKDAKEVDGKIRFDLPGATGNWDQSEVLKRFFGGGYRGDVCCEVSSQIWRSDPNYDPVAATRACYENMAAAFDKAGISRA